MRRAVELGADEIDMVIDRGALLSGEYEKVFDEIAATKEACGPAHLKVILETGELGTYDNVRKASEIGMPREATSSRPPRARCSPRRRLPVTLVMLQAIADYYYATGADRDEARGRRAHRQAGVHYLVIVKETLGDDWLTPDLFRFGASALLNDVLMQLEKERTGVYQSAEDSRGRRDTETHGSITKKGRSELASERDEAQAPRARLRPRLGLRAVARGDRSRAHRAAA